MNELNKPETVSEGTKPATGANVLASGLAMAFMSFVLIGGLITGCNWLVDYGGPGFSECKQQTKAMLLDPSSARFGLPSKATSIETPKIFKYRYTVTASNAYGGRIETVFNCIVDDTGPTRTFQVIGG